MGDLLSLNWTQFAISLGPSVKVSLAWVKLEVGRGLLVFHLKPGRPKRGLLLFYLKPERPELVFCCSVSSQKGLRWFSVVLPQAREA